jgi:hypothetical protein
MNTFYWNDIYKIKYGTTGERINPAGSGERKK